MEENKIGSLLDSPVQFYGRDLGEIKFEGEWYLRKTTIGTGLPIVTSTKTGKTFTLTWEDIINLARKAGVDEPRQTN